MLNPNMNIPIRLNQNINNPIMLNPNMNIPMRLNQNINNPIMPNPNLNIPKMLNQNINNQMMYNPNVNIPMIPNQNFNNPIMQNPNLNIPMMLNQNINNQMMYNPNMINPIENNKINGNLTLNSQKINEKPIINDNTTQMILDKKRKNLINSIIGFYKLNNLKNMDFNNLSQIKLLNRHLGPNFTGFKTVKHENKFNYIKENKILVNFVNSGYKIISVKIPYLITKSELYSIAELFKDLSRTNILLIHSESILEKNDSPIYNISEGDFIIIIEDRYYPDDIYLMQLKEKNIRSSDEKMNIILKDETKVYVKPEMIQKKVSIFEIENLGKFWTRSLVLSPNMLFSELLESIYLIFGSNPKDLRVIGPSGTFINLYENQRKKKLGNFLKTVNC